jgi:DNA-binding NtrC family response regulator
VRELENVIEQALVFAEGEAIDVAALPASVRGGLPENALALPPTEMSLPDILEDLERQLIQRAYDKSGGGKTETARLLGIKTSALYYKLEKYGIGVIESRSDKAAAAEPEGMLDDGPSGTGGGAGPAPGAGGTGPDRAR